jgi:hypothetical protein
MYPKPSFSKMKGQELVDAFNTYAMTSRRAKFSTNQEGIDCCEAEWKKWAKLLALSCGRAGFRFGVWRLRYLACWCSFLFVLLRFLWRVSWLFTFNLRSDHEVQS